MKLPVKAPIEEPLHSLSVSRSMVCHLGRDGMYVAFERIRNPGGDSWEQRALGRLPVQLMLEPSREPTVAVKPLLWCLSDREKRTNVRGPETGSAVLGFPSA